MKTSGKVESKNKKTSGKGESKNKEKAVVKSSAGLKTTREDDLAMKWILLEPKASGSSKSSSRSSNESTSSFRIPRAVLETSGNIKKLLYRLQFISNV